MYALHMIFFFTQVEIRQKPFKPCRWGQHCLKMPAIDTRLEVNEKGEVRILDKNGKDWSKSYADKFTEKLHQYGVHDVTYDAESPFFSRNEREKQIVQKIAQELSMQ